MSFAACVIAVSWSLIQSAGVNLGGIVQLVDCPTEKPGAVLTWVRVLGALRDFFSQSQFPVQTV